MEARKKSEDLNIIIISLHQRPFQVKKGNRKEKRKGKGTGKGTGEGRKETKRKRKAD
jgi:hypothetical protein